MGQVKKQPKAAMDTGTPEMSKRHAVKPELISQRSGKAVHMRVQDQTEIDRLLLNDWITVEEHQILEAFQGDVYFAGLQNLRAQDYGRVMGVASKPEMTNREAVKRLKVQRALAHVEKALPDLRDEGGGSVALLLMRLVLDGTRLSRKQARTVQETAGPLQTFYARWRSG